jgi:hypothetical protein
VLFGAARSGVSGAVTAAATQIVLAWTALAFAGGVAVRTQGAYVTVIAARVADENDERQARTPVAEERVRVARELHDVVAHHIAVINVHAGLARRAAGRDARTVDTSLGHVQDAARTVLDELGTVLSVAGSERRRRPLALVRDSAHRRRRQSRLGRARRPPATVFDQPYPLRARLRFPGLARIQR